VAGVPRWICELQGRNMARQPRTGSDIAAAMPDDVIVRHLMIMNECTVCQMKSKFCRFELHLAEEPSEDLRFQKKMKARTYQVQVTRSLGGFDRRPAALCTWEPRALH